MNVLAIGAHYDDVELGCGGTIARHVAAGDHVTIFVVTHSGYSNFAQKVIRSSEVALNEGRRAAEILGVARLIEGGFPTNNLVFDDTLTCAILKVIEDQKIDTLYTHWSGDVHIDHRAVARASITASRHVPRVLLYRSNYYDSDQVFRGNYYVDITDTLETKTTAVRAHESEYNRVGDKWMKFFIAQHQSDGLRIGVSYAEVFEVLKYLA